MRPFELVLILAILARLAVGAGSAVGTSAAIRRWTPSVAVALAVAAQVLLEGPRWNLAGVYAIAAILIARDLVLLARGVDVTRDGRRRLAAIVVGALGLAVAAAPALLLPVPQVPPPTGPWPVGTTSFDYLVPSSDAEADGRADTSDADAVDGAPTGTRVRARLWYPASETAASEDARSGPWLEHFEAMLPALGQRAGLPGWTLGHLSETEVHAVWDAPLVGGAGEGAEGRLGIVTFDHGRGGFAAQNTFLAEELASHGWLVVAPEHPGGAFLTVFDDGTRVPFDPASFGEGLEGAAYDAAIRELGRTWAGETSAALDALEAGAGPAGLGPRIDRGRIVATGHSTGGGAAFALCALEAGCRGVVGLDPWMLPVPPELYEAPAGGDPDTVLDVRVLALFSDFELGFFEPSNFAAFERLAEAVETAGGSAEHAVLTGAGHMDFADVGLLSPVADRLGLYVGPAPPRAVLPRVRAEVVAFLDAVP